MDLNDNSYIKRCLAELESQFNILWREQPPQPHVFEEVKEESMVLDEADAVDPEMKNEDFEEIRRSKVLMDIYGAKIK